MKTADIVIVGGGVIGLALAFRLASAGAKPLVLDAGSPSATMASAGMLAPSFEHGASPLAEPLYRLSTASLALWRGFAESLEAQSGETIDYRPFGVLGVAFRSSEEAALRLSFKALEARGAAAEWLGPEDVRRLEPAVDAAVACGLLAKDDGQVDARRLVRALRVSAERAGAEFVGVRAAAIGEDGVITLSDGASIAGGIVVVAAGSSVSMIRLPIKPPVFPVKGEALALVTPGALLRRVVRAPGAYLCPKADGRIIIGATEIPGDESLLPTERGVNGLRAAAARAAPATAALLEAERWAGLRPATPDGAPILGPSRAGSGRIVFALGHYRNGVLLAPATAELLSAFILGGALSGALDEFGPDRFNH